MAEIKWEELTNFIENFKNFLLKFQTWFHDIQAWLFGEDADNTYPGRLVVSDSDAAKEHAKNA